MIWEFYFGSHVNSEQNKIPPKHYPLLFQCYECGIQIVSLVQLHVFKVQHFEN